MTRHGSRDGTHFRKKLLNADGPVERILILLVIAVVAGVTIGLLMPKANPTVGEITGEYTASGSAAQTLQQLTVDDNQRHAGYDRDLFGFRQTDDDGNGCDVREDVLARDLTDVRYRQHGCKVESGTLADPYTGKTIHFVRGARTSSAVQIDHVVALSDAWQKGAQKLSEERRTALANDPYNLLAVQGRANQKKSDGDAATWLPSNKGFRCEYVARQIGVKHKYSLWVTQAEKEAMAKVLSSCPTQTVPDYTGVKDSTAEKTTESEQTEQTQTEQTQTEQSAEQAQQTQQTTQAPAPEPAPAPAPAPQPAPQQDVHYQNCTAARAAGAAPIYQGQPGYRSQLDRDHDGVACE